MEVKRFSIAIILLFITLVIFCGCLGETSPSSSDAANPKITPAADSGLRIITEEFPPFNYQDETGQISGQSTDVVNGILKRLNQKAEIELLPWTEGYNLILNEPNTVLYSTGRNDEREKSFKWVGPVAYYAIVFYAKSGSEIEINSLEDAKKAGKIAVTEDDVRHQVLIDNGFKNIILCNNDGEGFEKLMTGEADLWFGSSTNAADIARNVGYSPDAISAIYSVRTIEMYIAFNPDTPDTVISDWQNALDSMKKDGTFDAILENYGNAPKSTSSSETVGSDTETALFAIMSYTDAKITNILRPFEVIALTEEAMSNDWQNIKPLLTALEEKETDARLWYAHTNGSYYTVVDDLTSSNLMSRSYFPEVLSGRESVGTFVISHSTGKNVAIAAVPVISDDEVTGVLGSSIYLDVITNTLTKELPGRTFYAIDDEGRFVINSNDEQISQDILLQDPESSFGKAIEYMISKDNGEVEYESEGIMWTARFRKSPLTGWKYAVATTGRS